MVGSAFPRTMVSESVETKPILQNAPESAFHLSFASDRAVRKIQTQMLELEIYAAGLSDLDKILQLDHELAAIPGLRYKVDRNHNLVYFELDEPTITLREIRAIFRKLSLEPRFIGAIPPELRPRTKTQPLAL